MRRSFFGILCFLFVLLLPLRFLPKRLDSLMISLSRQAKDSQQVKTLVEISDEFNLVDSRQALRFGEEALRLANNLKWKKGMAMGCAVVGNAFYNQGNFANALRYRLKELDLWRELGNKRNICNMLSNVGVAYSDLGDNFKAIEYYLQSLKLAKENNLNENVVINLGNIGIIYEGQRDYEKALEYYSQALEMAESYGLEEYIAINSGNIGGVQQAQKNYQKAMRFYLEALRIDLKNGVSRNVYVWQTNIGSLQIVLADSAETSGNTKLANEKRYEAIKYFESALIKAEELGDEYMQSNITGNIGAVYTTLKKIPEAEKYLTISLNKATAIQSLELRQDAHENFYKFYKESQQTQKALEHFEKFSTIKDSLSEERNKKSLKELQVKYDTEKKDEENKELLHKNEIQELTIVNNRYFVSILLALIILILMGGVFIVRQNRLRSQALAIGLEQKLLRSQMNPHFIFNSLANIESFIYEKQPDVAALYLTHFSRLMRLILENSTKEYISIQKEKETLEYYLSLQKLRLNDNLDYSITVDEAIDTDEIVLPPMLTQPFIENSIEHGFRGIKQTGKVSVSFSLQNDTLLVEITDNGIGIVQAKEQKDLHKIHQSMAMKITEERLRFLNKSKGKKLYFTVTDLMDTGKNSTGTRVIFSIPVINNF